MSFDIYILILRGNNEQFYYRNYQKRGYGNDCWTTDIKKATIWTNKNHAKQALNWCIKKNKCGVSIIDLNICRYTAVYQCDLENEWELQNVGEYQYKAIKRNN